MKQTCSSRMPAAVVTLIASFLAFSPVGADAADRLVPTDFASIQTAIDAAQAGDSVVVEPGTYRETLTLKDNVTVRGRETARTFLSGGGGGPVVVVNGPAAVGIHNFTFISASTGIQITGNTSVLSVTNNVFRVGAGNTAISIQSSPQTEVVNNVFYQNGTAVSRDADLKIVNNIFMSNSTAITGAGALAANITSNDFFENSNAGPTGANPVLADPVFVDPVNGDFHLQIGSPCVSAGDTSVGANFDDPASNDIGAYGGPDADPTPFLIAGLTVTEATDTSISLAWAPNNDYRVFSYRLRYGYASGVYNGTDADGGFSPSPIDVFDETSITLFDLSPSSLASSAPVLDPPAPRDGKLILTWSAVPGATGYKVHYGALTLFENTVDVGDTTSYTIAGLTNGRTYQLAVSAYAQAKYFFVVTAVISTDAEEHESAFSPEVAVPIGPVQESALSNERADFPDPVLAYPALPNGRHSCFIATAAYGSSFAPEVLALRAFRDRYLLTNAPGRGFVEWYYRRGPAAAALLNAHPAWKPAVRAALMPAVGAAIFMTGTSTLTKAAAAFAVVSAIVLGFRRRRLSGEGEMR